MQPDAVQRRLEALSTIAAEDKPVNGLFRLLASPVIWEMAYASIRISVMGLSSMAISARTPRIFGTIRITRASPLTMAT